MGIVAIATFLNNSGYKKKLRQNNTIEGFLTSFVKGVLDNPVYCGKLAFGRRFRLGCQESYDKEKTGFF